MTPRSRPAAPDPRRRPPGWVIAALTVAATVAVAAWTIIGVGVFSVLHELSLVEVAVLHAAANPAPCELVPIPPDQGTGGAGGTGG